MTTETWAPNSQNYSIDSNALKKIIEKLENDEDFNISSVLTDSEKEQHSPIMQLSEKDWKLVTKNFSSKDIITLIKFFTLAEQQFLGWNGDKKSPVIYLAKTLRQRDEVIGKELLLWIKTNSNNKFLPYGAL